MKKKSLQDRINDTRLGFDDSRLRFFERKVSNILSQAYKADPPSGPSARPPVPPPVTSFSELQSQSGDLFLSQNGENLITQ
tara:strand:- start:144 stop:386 length:243 start_codon:yes stop_codon:yes gene_type:complete